MRNLFFVLRFEGTRYHGFQVQKNALSVCEVFQDALEKVTGSRHEVKGCSRTDTGVHAFRYGLSMKTQSVIPCERLLSALNRHLPGDIAVTACKEVPEGFHARYSAVGKEYVYTILNSHIKDPFSANFAYRYGYPLNVPLLHQEAQAYLGEHDFAAFQSKGGGTADTVRAISAFCVERRGEFATFTVRGNGFLYNMVRIMVGTLVFINAGKISQGAIPEIIKSRDRGLAGKTMPAKGLCLNRVFYGGQLDD